MQAKLRILYIDTFDSVAFSVRSCILVGYFRTAMTNFSLFGFVLFNENSSKRNLETMAGEDEETPSTITLRVRDSVGDEMFFKVKKDTKLSKLMDAYAQRKGINAGSLRFTLDGERIQKDHTPKMLEMEEDDQIDVMLETVGGM